MSESESAEVRQLRKDGKKERLDDPTIQSLIDHGVRNLSQIIDFDDDDFQDLGLPNFKVRQLKKLKEKLDKHEDSHDGEGGVDPDCREFLHDKGLSEATIRELAKIGVQMKSSLKHLSKTQIENLQLEPAQASVQRRILKEMLEALNRPSVADQGGVHLSGVKAEFGNVSGHSSAGMVKLENMNKLSTGVRVEDAKIKAGDISDYSQATLVDIKYTPMPLAPQPAGLELETTDEVVNVMSDGPLPDSFRVERCSPDFHSRHREGAYSMEVSPRGGALIINVQKVEGDDERRDGTDVDRDKLSRLFQQLHFNVTVYNDEDGLSAQEIKDKVQDFAAKANEEQGEAYVVCLLSHGNDEHLYGTDGALLSFDTVCGLFDDQLCPNLVGKPKLFFIQACRSEAHNLAKRPIREGGRSDMLVCFATQAGYEAFRDTARGSWFVEGITRVFAHFAKQEDVIHMMFRVHYAVQKKLKLRTAQNISPEIRLTLGHKLFFFPGIEK